MKWMRALTLTQPWCGLVASGIKLIENRPRPMIKREDLGKPFALHASREVDQRVYHRIAEIAPELATVARNVDGGLDVFCDQSWFKLSCITSAVIAVATIERAVVLTADDRVLDLDSIEDVPVGLGEQRRWLFGPVGYVLRDVRALATPVPCRGFQSFWYLTPKDERERGEVSAVERAVLEQLR